MVRRLVADDVTAGSQHASGAAPAPGSPRARMSSRRQAGSRRPSECRCGGVPGSPGGSCTVAVMTSPGRMNGGCCASRMVRVEAGRVCDDMSGNLQIDLQWRSAQLGAAADTRHPPPGGRRPRWCSARSLTPVKGHPTLSPLAYSSFVTRGPFGGQPFRAQPQGRFVSSPRGMRISTRWIVAASPWHQHRPGWPMSPPEQRRHAGEQATLPS